MNSTSISFLTKIYNNLGVCNIIRHTLVHDELYHISVALKSLRKSLGLEADEEYWQQTLRPIRRFIFSLCSNPLPPGTLAAISGIDWDKLHHQVRLCQQLYPDFHSSFEELVQRLSNLNGDSPFIGHLEPLCVDDVSVSVVINNPKMNQAVEKYFNGSSFLQKIEIVSSRQLQESHMCDRLVITGPCTWVPEYVFLSPHAHEIHVINFAWLHDPWKHSSVFVSDSASIKARSVSHCIGRLPEVINKSEQIFRCEDFQGLSSLDLLPPPLTFRKEMLHNAGCDPSHNEELTQAKLYHLAGECAVFMPIDDNAVQLAIDLSNTSKPLIRRVPVGVLKPDMYLLLRTAGGGDLLIPLANRILGKLAKERREQQAMWKSQLIAAAKKQFGELNRGTLANAVSKYLSSRGGVQASPANVLYWMSSKSIRPRKKEAFVAILEYSGIQDKSVELWAAMEEIERAHRNAGHTIRKMLLHRVSTMPLEPLKRDGQMIFDLGEQDGGSISAFQIISISDDEFNVPINIIGTLLDLGA